METRTVKVPGIHCGHCVMTIERELKELPGVMQVQADDGSKTVTVSWETPADWKQIEALLAEIGYPVAA